MKENMSVCVQTIDQPGHLNTATANTHTHIPSSSQSLTPFLFTMKSSSQPSPREVFAVGAMSSFYLNWQPLITSESAHVFKSIAHQAPL